MSEFTAPSGAGVFVTAPSGGSATPKLPVGYVRGCVMAWTNSNQVSVGAGAARDAADSLDIISLGYSASILIAGVNGLDTGVEAANTWYAYYLIADSSGANPTESILSASFVAPTLPAGYDKYRRVGCVRNGAASDFLKFTQVWNGTTRRYWYDESEFTTSVLIGGTSAALTGVSLSSFVPPTSREVMLATSVRGKMSLRTGGTTNIRWDMGLEPGLPDDTANTPVEVACSASQQIDYAVTSLLSAGFISVSGFDDEI